MYNICKRQITSACAKEAIIDMRQTYQHRVFAIPLYLSAFLVFVLLVFSTALCHAAVGFDIEGLKRIASFYKNERDEPRWFRLPDTDIKAGAFRYIFVPDPPLHKDKPGEEDETIKAALLVNDSEVYYVNSEKVDETKGFSDFDVGDYCHFGAYKDYFLMDCQNLFKSSNNRSMFLFRYGKDEVALLDVIVASSYKTGSKIGILDFESETVGDVEWTPNRRFKDGVPILAIIKNFRDIDNDKAPEVKIEIQRSDRFTRGFYLYLEIKDDRLKVDFNPKLYKPLFEHEKKMFSPKKKTNAYYIYGFLSGKLTMERIKTRLAVDMEQYDRVMPLLEGMGNLDAAFHEYDGAGGRPILKRNDIKRR